MIRPLLLLLAGYMLSACGPITRNLAANAYANKFDKFQKTLKPDFQLPNETGEVHSLSDYKGKVVFLSLGGLSCGACIAEIPYADSLKNRFKDRDDVAFVDISIERNTARWRKSIRNRNMQGIQLNDSIGYIESYYRTNVIPKYILIGKEGQLLGYDLPRPRDKVIVDYLIYKGLKNETAKTSAKKYLKGKLSESDRIWLENHMGRPGKVSYRP